MNEENEGWYADEKMVNFSAAKLKKLENLITKEHKFDSTPLGKAVCWKCGRVLCANVGTSRTYLVLPPKGLTESEAPQHTCELSHTTMVSPSSMTMASGILVLPAKGGKQYLQSNMWVTCCCLRCQMHPSGVLCGTCNYLNHLTSL